MLGSSRAPQPCDMRLLVSYRLQQWLGWLHVRLAASFHHLGQVLQHIPPNTTHMGSSSGGLPGEAVKDSTFGIRDDTALPPMPQHDTEKEFYRERAAHELEPAICALNASDAEVMSNDEHLQSHRSCKAIASCRSLPPCTVLPVIGRVILWKLRSDLRGHGP